MGLEEYRRKRDFRRTPEPAGEASPRDRRGALEFVVQKHAARQLHYDFRLELDGTLKSWAVPKGPSLDPSVRRLAMHVEDHPLEYGGFEGVIPEDEYGGGTVLLWDRGTWRPEGDPAGAYRRGRLKFTLEGEKLRGGWTLVRMGGRPADGGKESWLLIKESDTAARAPGDPDIVDERPESVATGRGLDEIAADRDRVWHSNRPERRPARRGLRRRPAAAAKTAAAKTARPAAVAAASIAGARKGSLSAAPRAQLATLVTTVPPGDDWLHEIKFDGYRLLCFVAESSARVITRNGNDWTEKFRGLVSAAAALPCEQALLDGEAVVLNAKGVSEFQALQNALGRKGGADVVYYAFDLLHLDGYDLSHATLRARKEALAGLLAPLPADAVIRFSDHVEGNGPAFHAQACGMGLEGIISKRADRPYAPGRGRDWLKIKCLHRQEFVIVGFTDPAGSRAAFGALMLGVHEDGRLVFAGRVGTGFTERSLRELHRKLAPLERKAPPIVDPPRGAAARGVHWVEPKLVAEVAFIEWTGDGRIRHPSFQGLREDKPASEVVRERPAGAVVRERLAAAAADQPEPRSRSARRSGTRRSGVVRAREAPNSDPRVAGVRITNADRMLYPEREVTKGDVARYWETVAELAMPLLRDRPLTLVRCPDGPYKPCFFQKHWGEGMPDAVPRIPVEESDGTELYMYVDGLPAVISLVQFGVLEFHVWNSRRDRLDRPDMFMFDLDPDEGLAWKHVAATALALRDRLAQLGLESFVKTTGGKGLHVVLPLTRRAGWDDVREFARRIALEFVKAEPRRYTASMSKRTRKGRIFIDYLRNAYNSTAVGAYSPRSRPGAPVSVPITWDELVSARERPVFAIPDMVARVASLERDPWAGFTSVRQSITAALLKEVGVR